jgi:hypothetical protein
MLDTQRFILSRKHHVRGSPTGFENRLVVVGSRWKLLVKKVFAAFFPRFRRSRRRADDEDDEKRKNSSARRETSTNYR